MRLEVQWRDGGDDTILFEYLQRSFEIERMMGADTVVEVLPVFEICIVIGRTA